MNYFISVNYGTSNIIKKWSDSIKKISSDYCLVIVDNFYSDEERKKTMQLCEKLDIKFLSSENIGYGAAIRRGIRELTNLELKEGDVIFAGNLDLEYLKLPSKFTNGKFAYVPRVIESNKSNRNPFLTLIQAKFQFLYFLAAKFESRLIYLLAILVNKILGFVPSKIWTVHGSLFCFNSECISDRKLPFNEDSFLYGEELEFGSFVESNNIDFINYEDSIHVFHDSHVATSNLISNQTEFIKIWSKSFLNWYSKWI